MFSYNPVREFLNDIKVKEKSQVRIDCALDELLEILGNLGLKVKPIELEAELRSHELTY